MENQTIFTQCGTCKNWEYPEGWKEKKPSGAIEGLHGNVSHGYCPTCFQKELDEITCS